ncbi:MAG: hypothetical protein KC493_08505 [Bacteriovoracaceae bacterium]|nr:hypothetical protein [Bacteriovoracaceae bacterium]
MEREFWLNIWEKGERLNFNQDRYHDLLLKYYSKLGLGLGNKVLVPLCGKTCDLEWLESKGLDVHGVELSPIATKCFFKERELDYYCQARGQFTTYSNKNVHIHCGDFFEFNDKGIKAIWDKASLVALPLKLRKKYYKKIVSLTQANSKWLLLTLQYDENVMLGPPFSISENEIHAHLDDYFEIDLLERNNYQIKGTKFEEAGLKEMSQNVFLLSRK